MKYSPGQFTQAYYQLWQMNLLLPEPSAARMYSVKFRKNYFDEYSRITLKARSVSDALERACYAVSHLSQWRPEDIDLHAVYDEEENLLWVDEPFYNIIQKKKEFRGIERRDFLIRFGATAAAILFGLKPKNSNAQTIPFAYMKNRLVISGEQLYLTPGTYTWTVPASVTSVCVVCVGGGGNTNSNNPYSSAGAGGGALAYKNNHATTAGGSISIQVGARGLDGYDGSPNGTSGGATVFAGTVTAGGGICPPYTGNGLPGGAGGLPSGHTGGGSGGRGGTGGIPSSYWAVYSGSGGAGGYSGNGGDGGTGGLYATDGTSGSGGGGGGGGGSDSGSSGSVASYVGVSGPGGGVGLYGQGSNGVGGIKCTANPCSNISGGGGSGGQTGNGGYGGGRDGQGALRIIWGAGRSFPNNAT